MSRGVPFQEIPFHRGRRPHGEETSPRVRVRPQERPPSRPNLDRRFYERVERLLAEAFSQLKLDTQAVADFGEFTSPSQIPHASSIEPVSPADSFSREADEPFVSTHMFSLLSHDLAIDRGHPTRGKRLRLANRLTGYSIMIEGENIFLLPRTRGGEKRRLRDLLGITPQNRTGTLALEGGVKLTFVFSETSGADSSSSPIDALYLRHPDGSYAVIKKIQGEEALDAESGTGASGLGRYYETVIPDGKTLFLESQGAGPAFYDSQTQVRFSMMAPVGLEEAGWHRASFGGTAYNFFSAPGTPPPPFPSFAGEGARFPAGEIAPPSISSVPEEPSSRVAPPVFREGHPPSNPVPNSGIMELIFSDLWAQDPTGRLEKKKQDYLQYQLRFGTMDLEAKLFIILYLFLDGNTREGESILGQLKNQSDELKSLSSDQLRARPGYLSASQTDASILQARLTQIFQDRTRMVDTITNALKSVHDYLHNAIRRIAN